MGKQKDKEFYDDEKYLSKAEKGKLALKRYHTKPELSYPEWERQENETLGSWEAFKMYRDMGAVRSLTAVTNELINTKSKFKSKHRVMQGWSTKWLWTDRIAAYQVHLDRIYLEQMEKSVKEMATRHAEYAKNTMQALYSPVLGYAKIFKEVEKLKAKPNKSAADKQRLKELGADNLTLTQWLNLVYKSAALIPSVADMERKSRGEPNNITSSDVTSGGEPIVPSIKIVVQGSQSTILKEYEG